LPARDASLTSSSQSTLLLTEDFHDAAYDEYSHSFYPIDGANFKITIYPTKTYYKSYITSYPRDVCICAVFLIAFTACIVLLYSKFVKNREIRFVEAAKLAFSSAASRDAVLLAKKSYVRYISHEMRTPLNSIFMGLKLLEIELVKQSDMPGHVDCLDTLKDVSKSCDLVLNILNDLLNYDKLEVGDMKLDKKSICLLPFMVDSVNSLVLQGKNKNVNLLFDLDELFALQPNRSRWRNGRLEGKSADSSRRSSETIGQPFWSDQPLEPRRLTITTDLTVPRMVRSPSGLDYLSVEDYIEADEQKLHQVISNLVSNAIKFTPSGRNVTIKMRWVGLNCCVIPSPHHIILYRVIS
jgi:signal transduction histidine kinase